MSPGCSSSRSSRALRLRWASWVFQASESRLRQPLRALKTSLGAATAWRWGSANNWVNAQL